MTHPEEAVELLARELSCDTEEEWADRVNWPDQAAGAATFRVTAIALLDRLAPLLVAAEREACAAMMDERAAVYAKMEADLVASIGGSSAHEMLKACRIECEIMATAIRQRSNA